MAGQLYNDECKQSMKAMVHYWHDIRVEMDITKVYPSKDTAKY